MSARNRNLEQNFADNEELFNLARLLALFDILDEGKNACGANIERVAYYDFFSAHPMLIFNNDKTIKLDLLLIGFESMTISYISSSQRFANRREKLKHYLAGLLIRDLISVTNYQGQIVYSITCRGKEVASEFKSMYIKAYRRSAELIINRLSKMSDKALATNAKAWLKAESFMIDLYDY